MRNSVKLIAAAAVMTYAVTASITAQAGQEPYIAWVGEDRDTPDFYVSEKHQQQGFAHLYSAFPGEGFDASASAGRFNREVCDAFDDFREETSPSSGEVHFNRLITANNKGFFEWDIVLPKKLAGNINITVQCGVLKPNTSPLVDLDGDFSPILLCAGETGENIGSGFCTRALDNPNVTNILRSSLPKLEVTATPQDGNFNPADGLDPFHLTAYRNPSGYAFNLAGGALRNSRSLQILDGTLGARVVLKACMTKSIFVKKPVDGQINVLGETEVDLIAGDRITVRMIIPRNNTMDIYCHQDSVSVRGLGEPEVRICWDARADQIFREDGTPLFDRFGNLVFEGDFIECDNVLDF